MEQYEPDRLSAAQVAAMRRSFRNGRAALTRRSLLRASAGGALAVGGGGALSGCGIPAAGKTQGGVSAEDHSKEEKTVNFSNWTEYMDVDDSGRRHPTLEAFTKRTGIKVEYTEDINDNTEFFGKIKPQLAAGQDTGRDIIVLTDWLAARLIRLGWAQKLDPAHTFGPDAFASPARRDSGLRGLDWDPGREDA
ncbi:Spermidine/putrescine transport system substrate-binding protein OS=Streptomyces griseomycini OX=66895 GN=FHS37_006412 PE=4 SV=1 [Streptomyces griseomycini]